MQREAKSTGGAVIVPASRRGHEGVSRCAERPAARACCCAGGRVNVEGEATTSPAVPLDRWPAVRLGPIRPRALVRCRGRFRGPCATPGRRGRGLRRRSPDPWPGAAGRHPPAVALTRSDGRAGPWRSGPVLWRWAPRWGLACAPWPSCRPSPTLAVTPAAGSRWGRVAPSGLPDLAAVVQDAEPATARRGPSPARPAPSAPLRRSSPSGLPQSAGSVRPVNSPPPLGGKTSPFSFRG
jgi:hypothetical protein